MRRGMLRGMAAFRWAAWAWLALIVLLNRTDMSRPWIAWALVALAFAWTAAATMLLRRAPELLEGRAAILVELAIGAALSIGGGLAYPHTTVAGQAFSSVRTLGFAWPLAGIISAGVVYGTGAGLVAGVAVAAPRWFAPLLNGLPFKDYEGQHFTSLASTTLLYSLTGAVAGYIATLLDRAESAVAAARAREDVARTLHDGVLQTLAIIERRADDQTLARMAREQERELREFLFGAGPTADRGGAADVGPRLRAAAARFEDAYGGRAEVVLAPDLPHLDGARADALAGAVGEALNNAGKHGRATRVTVYAEPDPDGAGRGAKVGIMCSVRDDGTGFEPDKTREGVGLSRSIRGRITEVGGRVDIESRPGTGTEVRLWLP